MANSDFNQELRGSTSKEFDDEHQEEIQDPVAIDTSDSYRWVKESGNENQNNDEIRR